MASGNSASGRGNTTTPLQESFQAHQGLPARPIQRVDTYIPDVTAGVLRELHEERLLQDEKWGEQNHSPEIWMTVIMEEVGEASQEVLRYTFTDWGAVKRKHRENMRNELVQVGAVTVAAIESIDRQNY